MEQAVFSQVFDTLQLERARLAERAESARAELRALETRLKDLDGVISGLVRLELVDVEPEDSQIPAGFSGDASTAPATRRDAPEVPSGGTRQRIRSTEMVAEMVNAVGRALTREEVLSEFETRYGYPETWANPRNAIGNALSRAHRRGWVTGLDGDRWAPSDWPEGTGLTQSDGTKLGSDVD